MSAPELRLKRFLNYGKESPLYLPGNRLIDPNYFSKERSLTAIDDLISFGKYTDAAAHIVKVHFEKSLLIILSSINYIKKI